MSQNAHILIHRPGDYIFVMSRGGVITAHEVNEDGYLTPVDVAVATAQVSLAQKEQLDKGPFPF